MTSCPVRNWSYTHNVRGKRCAATCGEPLRGPCVEWRGQTYHMHCALDAATREVPAPAAPAVEVNTYWPFVGVP